MLIKQDQSMSDLVSPKYQMSLIKDVIQALEKEYPSIEDVRYYIEKWHEVEHDWNNHSENFLIREKDGDEIDLLGTIHNMSSDVLIKIAIDLGLETPDYIPSISSFKNVLKSDYRTANSVFEKAVKQIETHPDLAIGLANSALEGIIREILQDERIKVKPKSNKTLYELTSELLKELQLFPDAGMPIEIRTIGSSLLNINQNIEKLRSEKTDVHGKLTDDDTISDAVYAYFIVNSVTTIGKFLISFYKIKFPPLVKQDIQNDDLPF